MDDDQEAGSGPSRITALEWRQIVNSATDTAIISTDREGRITSWNRGAERILGWSEAEMLGQTLQRIFTGEDQARGRLAQEMADALAHGRGGGEEGWRLRKNGTRFWAAGEMAPIYDAFRNVVGFIKIIRDRTATQREITERRRAEDALRELNATLEQQVAERTAQLRVQEAALRQSQKMEAVGQLTGGVAHDFNNLLQIIIGNLEILQRNLPPDAGRLQRAAAQAMNGARRAASLTQRLLAFSRRQPLDPKSVDVNLLVGGMSELLHRTLGETIAVEAVRGVGLWRVEVDPNELESVILNLAVNARDAMPDGGRLTIETSNTYIDEVYAAAQAEVFPGQYVSLSVSDTGTGMDAETLNRAFEPFFTTKPIGKGTGLGLSQVYGFVKQSGGHVKIYSEVGHGTTVKIYLPRLTESGAGEAVATESHLPEGSSEETVLVVEDDDDVRTYSVETLRELGYRVIEAHDGPSALRLLERQPRVDLLFTDVVLPTGMTGAELAAQAHALQPQLKILFTTGYARNAIIHHGRLDKGVHLITKPFSFSELAAKVRDVLDAQG